MVCNRSQWKLNRPKKTTEKIVNRYWYLKVPNGSNNNKFLKILNFNIINKKIKIKLKKCVNILIVSFKKKLILLFS